MWLSCVHRQGKGGCAGACKKGVHRTLMTRRPGCCIPDKPCFSSRSNRVYIPVEQLCCGAAVAFVVQLGEPIFSRHSAQTVERVFVCAQQPLQFRGNTQIHPALSWSTFKGPRPAGCCSCRLISNPSTWDRSNLVQPARLAIVHIGPINLSHQPCQLGDDSNKIRH